MDIDLFDYELPPEAIAQEPAERRDASRLMVVNRASGAIEHAGFSDLPSYLRPGDLLVFNDSRVIPARLHGTKRGGGAAIEVLLAQPLGGHDIDAFEWNALARPARRLKPGDVVDFAPDFNAELLDKLPDGSVNVRLSTESTVSEAIELYGEVPLPPYISRSAEPADSERYQTVYAQDPGSVAAPTAGLHFTDGLLAKCEAKGVETARVTLHVGIGTFQTVQAQRVEEHKMHSEWCRIDEITAGQLNRARQEGRRIICVGTTSVRTLESFCGDGPEPFVPGWRQTDIFIYPGYRFKAVDALITNFHLPKSTLLMLVSAFYDRERMLAAYAEALREGYRFFSYGDAMLIV